MSCEQERPIVVGVDGSPGSDGALRYGIDEAERRDVGLRLVHVGPVYVPMTPMLPFDPGDIESVGHAILRETAVHVKRTAPGLALTTMMTHGSRVAGLVAASRDARLLVVGHETRSGVERLLTGAGTAAVAARSVAPVVVVPQEWELAAAPGRVVVGIKSDAHGAKLLSAAFAHAAEHGTAVVVLHAWKFPDPYADLVDVRAHGPAWLSGATELVEGQLADWRVTYPDVPVTVRVVHDEPAHALVAAGAGADLLFLLCRPAGRLGAHLGSTARSVLHAATCPVEVVPATDLPADPRDRDPEHASAVLR